MGILKAPDKNNQDTGIPQGAVRRTSEVTRMADMIAAAKQRDGWRGLVRTDDGWRRPLPGGFGFRHDYDADIANGSWEFRVLRRGLCLAIVNYTVQRGTPRRHCPGNNLVISAVLSGSSHIRDGGSFEGELAHGYCTIYGLHEADEFQTFYKPDEPLKWVSVFIERCAFFGITGLHPDDLAPALREFLIDGEPLTPRNIPMSTATLLAASEIFDNSLEDSFGQAYLTAKALELACQILYIQARSLEIGLSGPAFSSSDFDRLKHAKKMLEQNLDRPLNIQEFSRAAGLTRQKLQLGFRLLFGDTVARVRDKIRMEHALNLVRTSALSITQVALETGYEHHSSFTRAFKAAFGMCPAQMRRLTQQSSLLGEARSQSGSTARG